LVILEERGSTQSAVLMEENSGSLPSESTSGKKEEKRSESAGKMFAASECERGEKKLPLPLCPARQKGGGGGVRGGGGGGGGGRGRILSN